MAFVTAFTGLSLRAAPTSATSPTRPTMASKKSKAKPAGKAPAEKKPAEEKPAAEKKAAAARSAAAPEPAGGDAPLQYYPLGSRNLAPHIVFLSNSAIALDNCEVVPARPARSDAPDPALYAEHFPKDGDTLNWAPHVGVTNYSSSVSVAMTRVAPGTVGRDDAPDSALFEKYYPAATRDLAPEIVVVDRPGTVGVEMKAVTPLEAVADTDTAASPAAYEEHFKNDHTLHMAPHISMSDGVVKCQMRAVASDVDCDRPPFESFPQYEAFGGLNRAPVIAIGSKGGGDHDLGMSMEDCPTFVSFNAAPVIEFTGERGRGGIKLQMQMIEGDADAVDRSATKEKVEAGPPATYSSSWKPASTLVKAWV